MRKSLLLIFVLFLGCGDSSTSGSVDSGSGQCGSFTPCGGAIVGTWSITDYCANLTGLSSYCSGMSVTTQVKMSGTLNFTSGGTYSIATTASGTETLAYPESCLGSQTCAQLGSSLNSGTSGVSGSCQSDASGVCDCTVSVVNAQNTEQGTYTTSGSSITMLKTGSTTATDSTDLTEYCVQGNTLKLQATRSTASGSAVLVASKQ